MNNKWPSECFMILLLMISLLTSCSSTPSKKSQNDPSQEVAYTEEELWHAISQLAFVFPIHDQSKEDGTVESTWIYENQLSRYKFFVTIEKDKSSPEFFVDIQNQNRKSDSSEWTWTEPSMDKEEKIKHFIHEHLKKNRAA